MPVNILNLSSLKILDFKETGHDYHADARWMGKSYFSGMTLHLS